MEKNVLMIVGSLRKNSFNRQLANEVAALLDGKAQVSFLDYAQLPFMNQDIEFPAPAEVERVRAEVEKADGIWIVTAEYNFSYPGVLKNLLDWLSRPLKPNDFAGGTSIGGKKIAISGVGGRSAAAGSRQKFLEVLKAMRTQPMETPQTAVALGMEDFQTDRLPFTDEIKGRLKEQAEAFLKFIEE